MSQRATVKMISGRVKRTVEMIVTENKIELDFSYDEYLKDEIKAMDGARWNPEGKTWTIKNNRHNKFQLEFLMGLNPYAPFDVPLIEFEPRIPLFKSGEVTENCLYPQQYQMAQEGLTYKTVIWAAEMGLGKTLAAFMVMENSGIKDWWWVGPHSALASFEVEVAKWGLKTYPTRVMTYEALTKTLKNWVDGDKAPQGVILDESSRLKTPTAQRSIAAWNLAEGMRDEWGDNNIYIIEMTGTPSPKAPTDWFNQCETARPGFIREGNIAKFRKRLAILEEATNQITGGQYSTILGWKDNSDKCQICALTKDDHDFVAEHVFIPGVNEIEQLYKRLKGLVSVYFKKDWLSFLPEKQYRVLQCKVTRSAQNAAQAVKSSAKSAIQALTMMRELSDGFLYENIKTGTFTKCKLCEGSGRLMVPDYGTDETEDTDTTPLKMIEGECSNCQGIGEIPDMARVINTAKSPKDDLLEEIIDDHDDNGRLVTYAGFTGSIDRVISIYERKGWSWIRVDGRGWASNVTIPKGPNYRRDLLQMFQDKSRRIPKVAFVGHPGSAGMGLTLTESSEIVFFSNDFNAESRMQAEDRIHRPGMDVNKGAMITDLVHLPSDLLVLENLRKKRALQNMSLGQLQAAMQ